MFKRYISPETVRYLVSPRDLRDGGFWSRGLGRSAHNTRCWSWIILTKLSNRARILHTLSILLFTIKTFISLWCFLLIWLRTVRDLMYATDRSWVQKKGHAISNILSKGKRDFIFRCISIYPNDKAQRCWKVCLTY